LRQGDTLVCYKLDRLGRGLGSLIDFVGELCDRGIDFRTLHGSTQIDTSSAQGRFFFHVMAALAEVERDLIRERANAGLAAARARSRKGGRKPKLTAQQICHPRKLLADPQATITEVAASLTTGPRSIGRSVLARQRTGVRQDNPTHCVSVKDGQRVTPSGAGRAGLAIVAGLLWRNCGNESIPIALIEMEAATSAFSFRANGYR
jgi:DNA invertase Pin-like site-specific DNA recombinase